ncbi:hypothetical protein [Nostoc sp. FACHB-190]|uniref:hypothetical protein n=1 Tax=Nostoc sp. FACHB-190 TaxID=2692838 RepID=UPI0016842352|nr:hypothetical protein [Nostoc sp. FACHB-190]MBD2301742.1 hypothetical protein [Nostoc sp. FACHB-190]
MKQIIEDVKQTIAQKKILWAYPIVQELQKYHYSLAIKWGMECIKIYSVDIKSDKFSKLDKYVQQAIEEVNFLTSLQCYEVGQEIWYLPEREEIQTAIARLWWSIEAFKNEEEHLGRMETTAAVELVLSHISDYHLLVQYLEAAVRIYEEYKSQN